MKELKIRGIYVRVGRRVGYIQRKRYEYGREEEESLESIEKLDGGMERIHELQEEDRLLKGISDRSRGFTRERGRRRLRRSGRCYRTRKPGRLRQESRKREGSLLRRNSGRLMRRWNWYISEVDVRRSDRRRNIGRYGRRIWGRWTYRQKESVIVSGTRIEIRGRRVWIGRRIWVLRSDERYDVSTRRSRRRSGVGYRRCVEARRRGLYRRKGRVARK